MRNGCSEKLWEWIRTPRQTYYEMECFFMINIIHDHQFKASGSHLYAKIGHVWVVRGIFAHFGHQTCLKIDSTHKKRMKSEMSFFILHPSSFPQAVIMRSRLISMMYYVMIVSTNSSSNPPKHSYF